MLLSLIAAASENNAIGKNNQLLWHLPNDMKFFKNTTWGMPVIMGRKTFDALGKALPGRINIVITRQPGWNADNALVAADLDDAIRKAEATSCLESFVIGGGEVYHQSLPMARKIYLTRVHANLDGDVFFPTVDETQWNKTGELRFPADEKHIYAYTFETWEKA